MRSKQWAAVGLVVAAGVAVFAWPRSEAHAATTAKPAVSIVPSGGACSSEFCYEPAALSIFQAQTVVWTNNTGTIHTVTSCTTTACDGVGPGTGTDPAFNSGVINAGSTFSLQFHGTGTYNYYCEIHGYAIMHGTITVNAFAVKTATLANGKVGKTYSAKLKTDGGQSPFTWSITSGTLPRGLKLSTSGTISGRPKAAGTSSFTVQVTDSSSPVLTAQKALSIKVT